MTTYNPDTDGLMLNSLKVKKNSDGNRANWEEALDDMGVDLDLTLADSEAVYAASWTATEVDASDVKKCRNPVLIFHSVVTGSPTSGSMYLQIRKTGGEWITILTISLGAATLRGKVNLDPIGSADEIRLSGVTSGADASNKYTLDVNLEGR